MVATVACATNVSSFDQTQYGTLNGVGPYSWSASYTNRRPQSDRVNWYFRFNASAYVEPGQSCTVGDSVWMTVGDYESMINSASVVTKLDEGFNLAVVLVFAVLLVAGVFFGWRVGGRGSGRSS